MLQFSNRTNLRLLILLCFISSKVHLFSQTKFSQPIDKGTVDNTIINEASGIDASIMNKDVLWTHNDSGGNPQVFALNTNGVLLGVYTLQAATARDWEDITIGTVDGKQYIYAGDIGDNNSAYDVKYVYRFLEPTVSATQARKDATITSYDKLSFVFPDGKRDCETMMFDPLTKDLIFISKRETNVNVYRWKYPQSLNKTDTLRLIATLNTTGIVGGDISNSGREILFKSYNLVYYLQRATNETLETTFKKALTTVTYVMEPQGEAICFSSNDGGYYVLSEESPLKVKPHLYFYNKISSVEVHSEMTYWKLKLWLD